MILHELRLPGQLGLHSLRIGEGRFLPPGKGSESGIPALSLGGAWAFPGLINSHDHLDFNLFPPLGHGPYPNYMAWGRDIHSRERDRIHAVLQVPRKLRTRWGEYKNLLNGVTTVVQHGPAPVLRPPLIRVFRGSQSLHSVAFEKYWRWRLNNPLRRQRPVAIHIGEGVDAPAAAEIDELIRWNLLQRTLVGVHGLAMTPAQAGAFRALVWCPSSNDFLFGKTLPVERLAAYTSLVFGTDSTLTAPWDLWAQLRQARRSCADATLYGMLTTAAATVWGLDGRGRLAPGMEADLVIACPPSEDWNLDGFFSLSPPDLLLVLCRGEILLFDERLAPALRRQGLCQEGYDAVRLGGTLKWLRGPVLELLRCIREHYPEAPLPLEAP